jgi:hypothetical protein
LKENIPTIKIGEIKCVSGINGSGTLELNDKFVNCIRVLADNDDFKDICNYLLKYCQFPNPINEI